MKISFKLSGLPVKLEYKPFENVKENQEKNHIKVGFGSLQIGEVAKINLNVFRNQETQELWAITPSTKKKGKFVSETYIPKEIMEVVNAHLNDEKPEEQPEEEDVWLTA